MTLFQNKYRAESHRLSNWDYSQNGIYFITFCVENNENLFGEIIDNEMILNDLGEIIKKEIIKSEEIRSSWIFHSWVIMPNHLHFLIEIEAINNSIENNDSRESNVKRKPNSISSFVAIFKSVTTKQINMVQNTENEKIWQNNYHDHIVKDFAYFNTINNYIINNPLNWQDDKFR